MIGPWIIGRGEHRAHRHMREQRGMFLTCMPADRANVGRTGIGLDAWLSDKLGVRGFLGSARRVGMSDLFHCFDGYARKVWHGGKKEQKEASRLEQDSETEWGHI